MSDQTITLGPKVRIGFTNNACIHCGTHVDVFRAASDPGKEAEGPPDPVAGDISMCIRCGKLQAINDACDGFRALSADELAQADASEQIKRLREAQKVAAAHGGAKSVKIIRRDQVVGELANIVYDQCLDHFGISPKAGGRGRLNGEQIKDIASVGMTLVSAHIRDMPYDERLNMVTAFVRELTTYAFGPNIPPPLRRR